MKRLSWLLAILGLVGLLPVQTWAQENGHKKVIVVHRGKVTTFQKLDPAVVAVKTDKGEIEAELAPAMFLEKQNLVFNPDDDISVKGFEEVRAGKRVFVVTEVTKGEQIVRLRGDDYMPVWTKTAMNGHTPLPAGAKLVTHTGTVRKFERGELAIVTFKAPAGDVRAELAPMTFIEEQKILLNPDDEIIVRGYEFERAGMKAFVVTELTTKDKRVIRFRGEDFRPVWVTKTSAVRALDLTGAVTVVDTMDTPDGRLVTIKTDDGERVIALGPGPYLEKNRYEFKTGDTIFVKGHEVDRSGRKVFLAWEVKKGDNVWKFRRHDGTPLWDD